MMIIHKVRLTLIYQYKITTIMSESITIPKSEWNEVKKLIKNAAYNYEELLTEEEAAKLLGISKRSMIQYVCSGRITRDMYRKALNGKRSYYKYKLLGK